MFVLRVDALKLPDLDVVMDVDGIDGFYVDLDAKFLESKVVL